MLRRPPRSTLFPTRRSSDLVKLNFYIYYRVPAQNAERARAVVNALQREHYRTRSDRKSTRLNSSHLGISYAVFCLKKKTVGLKPAQDSGGHQSYAKRHERED